MIFVPHLVGNILYLFLDIFFSCLHYLFTKFTEGAALGRAPDTPGKGIFLAEASGRCQEDKVWSDVGKVEFILRAKEEFAGSDVSILPHNFPIFDHSQVD